MVGIRGSFGYTGYTSSGFEKEFYGCTPKEMEVKSTNQFNATEEVDQRYVVPKTELDTDAMDIQVFCERYRAFICNATR